MVGAGPWLWPACEQKPSMEPPRLGAPGTPHSSTTTVVTHPDGTTVSTTTTCCAAPGVESEPPYVTEEWLALEYSGHAPKSVPIATRKLLREVVPGTQPVVCPLVTVVAPWGGWVEGYVSARAVSCSTTTCRTVPN
eukprot:COSAG01_NODE_7754_length_3069_cov_1.636364_5_plen_136_part_00